MSVNLNNAPEQKEMAGAIPPKSVVWVRLNIREASGKRKKSDKHPLMTVSASNANNHYFDCEYEVISPSFSGNKIWDNRVVTGSEKAVNISMAFFRAALEAARGIDPNDSSPAATNGRTLNDWSDLQGLEFPIQVGIVPPKAGDQYINNNITKAITPDKPEYAKSKKSGEIITDNPIPEIPQGQPGQQQNVSDNPWTQSQTQQPEPPPIDDKNVPAWAR